MLLDIQGRHNIFETYGYNSPAGQFHLEVDYGILRWSHSNGARGNVFEVAGELVPLKVWTHVTGTYNSSTGIAQIYIDGKPVNRTYGPGKLSKDWTCLAHIGGRCNNKALMGFVDEFRIYNYALNSQEVKELFSKCKFIKADEKTIDANTQPSGSIVTQLQASLDYDSPQDGLYMKKSDIPNDKLDKNSLEYHPDHKLKGDKIESKN
ncbi:hypothetical protein RF11_09123 [Thelohanellus kitauei]|uniref:LamG-like jellyroll fold domain-containing protein n=1 Tax=Thelohanellus kitauei TaxID=669202 RepID=A0A0C2NAK6_THEKT|nr:hypothetical protein RF11_09123 [Thelohanellus kitauei]